ncbi:hypothetical protein FRC09_007955 [Ceratobasidium sp. 395]|nr:hypothetical protein FRC09_007955 [Ceratobasidium sp. 395]
MLNENNHMHLAVVDTENAPNQEPVAVDQIPAAGNPVGGDGQNQALPQAQPVIQGPNQVVLGHVQPAPPPVVAAAVINVPNVALPNLLQFPIPALGFGPALMPTLPAVNGNPINLPLMRTLYGFPNIPMEDEHDEGEDVQDGADDGA